MSRLVQVRSKFFPRCIGKRKRDACLTERPDNPFEKPLEAFLSRELFSLLSNLSWSEDRKVLREVTRNLDDWMDRRYYFSVAYRGTGGIRYSSSRDRSKGELPSPSHPTFNSHATLIDVSRLYRGQSSEFEQPSQPRSRETHPKLLWSTWSSARGRAVERLH